MSTTAALAVAPFTLEAVEKKPDDIITVVEVAAILKCRPSSVYNLTRKRAKRYKHTPLPVIRLPLGLRFKRSSVLKWLDSLESTGAV